MRKILLIAIICLLVTFSSFPVLANTSDFEITWFSIDSGGTMESSAGAYMLSGTFGQPDAGVISGGDYTMQGGFWNSDTANTFSEIFMPVVVK